MHAKYEVSITSKVIAKVKVEKRQTDAAKAICPGSFDPGGITTITFTHLFLEQI